MFVRSPTGRSPVGQRRGLLLDRQRLAGQRRLLDLQVDGLDEPRVGRDAVAGLRAGRRRRARARAPARPPLAVAQDGRRRAPPSRAAPRSRARRGTPARSRAATANSTITAITIASVPWPSADREADRDQQDEDQHVLELLEEQLPRRGALGRLELVRAALVEPPRGLVAAQPGRRVGTQPARDVVELEAVPGVASLKARRVGQRRSAGSTAVRDRVIGRAARLAPVARSA